MAKYMVLFHDNPADFQDVGQKEMQAIVGKYVSWIARLEGEGRYLGGQKLMDSGGRVVRRGAGKLSILDGPYSETKEVLGGYVAIQADSYDEVVAQLHDCPHLEFSGTVEVREIHEI